MSTQYGTMLYDHYTSALDRKFGQNETDCCHHHHHHHHGCHEGGSVFGQYHHHQNYGPYYQSGNNPYDSLFPSGGFASGNINNLPQEGYYGDYTEQAVEEEDKPNLLRGVFKTAWNTTGLGLVGNTISNMGEGFKDISEGNVLKGIGKVIISPVTGVVDTVKGAWEGIKETGKSIWNGIKGLFGG